MSSQSNATAGRSSWLSLFRTSFMGLRWAQKLLVLMPIVCTVLGAVLWVNYKCCYWPFRYNPFPEVPRPVNNTLKQRVAHVASLLRSHVPDRNPDAAVLSSLAEKGRLVRMDIIHWIIRESQTNEYYQSANADARCLFSRSNRIDRAAPNGFWTNTPYYVVLYTTNGPVAQPILYDVRQNIWRFGNYYFSLRGPTNFLVSLNAGAIWEWPASSNWYGL
jgi:hypothetical protein